jgi:hypothetical protein
VRGTERRELRRLWIELTPPAGGRISGGGFALAAARPFRSQVRDVLGAGYGYEMETFVAVYLMIGFLIGFGLLGWLAVSTVRREGFRRAIGSGARTYLEYFPRYWRVPVVAWTFVIALPLMATWATLKGDFDAVGAIFVFLLWMLCLGLLR